MARQEVGFGWFAILSRVLPCKNTRADSAIAVDVPKPTIIEDEDVILKVTGTTICGSDLHLYHGKYRFPPDKYVRPHLFADCVVYRRCPRDEQG